MPDAPGTASPHKDLSVGAPLFVTVTVLSRHQCGIRSLESAETVGSKGFRATLRVGGLTVLGYGKWTDEHCFEEQLRTSP